MQLFVDGTEERELPPVREGRTIVCFAGRAEAARLTPLLCGGFPTDEASFNACFAQRGEFDSIALYIPHPGSADESFDAALCFSKGVFLFFCDLPEYSDDLVRWARDTGNLQNPEKILQQFFDRQLDDGAGGLARFEDDISALEDRVVSGEEISYAETIGALRRKLRALKHYYESLLTVLEDLAENKNELLSAEQLNLVGFLNKRADRQYHSLLNLRDYVTQVREAYQAQMDIGLNRTMKLFTVITVIFLPLSLIAGWYGMNLQMPEFAFKYAYAIVIALCALIVIGCVGYFKKNRWF